MDLRNKMQIGLSVLRYQFTRRPTPIAVAWLITGRCNLVCHYCKWKMQRQTEELDTAAVKDLIDQMRRAGVRLVSFTGGEPLLRKDMGEIIRHVKQQKLVCKLNTNGLMVPDRLEDLRPLDLLQISVDGPPEVMDRLRGRGTSEKAARAVAVAQQAKIPVQLIACLTRDNVNRIDDILRYGLELGVGFCFQVLTTKYLADEEIEESVPAKDDLAGALKYLLDLQRRRDPKSAAIASKQSELQYYLRVLENGSPGCECALVTATILPDGKLIFCGNAREGTYESFDAVKMGFAGAFSKLAIPECDGCVCVGKLRLSKVYQMDTSVISEMIGWPMRR